MFKLELKTPLPVINDENKNFVKRSRKIIIRVGDQKNFNPLIQVEK
jgi:hypothetical protein